MNNALTQLIQALTLKQHSETEFEGQPIDLGLRQLYGGLIFAEAISAGIQYMENMQPEQMTIHYATASFLNPGRVDIPIRYLVTPLRLGKSFVALQVVAFQNTIELIRMQLSFHILERGFEHQQTQMPQLSPPEDLIAEQTLAIKVAHLIPETIRPHWTQSPAIEVRPEIPLNPFLGQVNKDNHRAWFRLNGELEAEPKFLSYALLAYHSDHNLLPSSLISHGKGFLEKDMQVATLNHTIWFHAPINLHQWHAYVMESPVAKNALALVRGEIFDTIGQLVATVQQEGLIRQHH